MTVFGKRCRRYGILSALTFAPSLPGISIFTVEQFHILRYVRRGIGSMSELATAKNISRPAISQAVDILVNKGLLTRVQSTQDRRFVELALTDEGNALLDTVFKETRGWMKERMSALSADELETIAKAMEVYEENVGIESSVIARSGAISAATKQSNLQFEFCMRHLHPPQVRCCFAAFTLTSEAAPKCSQ